jgi:cytochrome c-type biogenesis protein CcmH
MKSLRVAVLLGALTTAPLLSAAWVTTITGSAHAAGEHQGAAVDVSFSEYVPGAARLEGRVRAPCCWNQTLDIHASETSNDLRREIRRRLKAGESADAIEESIVARYGPRVLAAPPGNSMGALGTLLSVVVVLGGAGAVWLLFKRWRGRAEAPSKPAAPAPRDALDDRLDAELEKL